MTHGSERPPAVASTGLGDSDRMETQINSPEHEPRNSQTALRSGHRRTMPSLLPETHPVGESKRRALTRSRGDAELTYSTVLARTQRKK